MQARGVLAIAADIRTHEHIAYTPAPDIVHESAGHAPIIKDARYAEYLKRCGVAGFKAIASREDQAVFEAIRRLSVVKEDPAATAADVEAAEAGLETARAGRSYVSESTKASRLYWWTAEYGLVGTLDQPKLYGAGLLSSIGEAGHCLTPEVRKLPLSLACVDQDFDITRMQPQLYVARDFDHLFEVLEQFEATLAWRRGGDYALEEALRAGTVNHLLLADGRELTGRVAGLVRGDDAILLAILEGPVMISTGGVTRMREPWRGAALVAFGPEQPLPAGPFARLLGGRGPRGALTLQGVRAAGPLEDQVEELRGTLAGQPLALPGSALLLFSAGLPGLAGGPADPEAWDRWFGAANPACGGDAEALARKRKAEALPARLGALYLEVAGMRAEGRIQAPRLRQILEELDRYPDDWLLRCEVGELLDPPGA
jgi:phenylalanine-4-hydroxylase